VSKLLYCDQCASDRGLEIQEKKVIKGTCEVCQKRIDFLNEKISGRNGKRSVNIGSFQVKKLEGFLPGLSPQSVHPNMPYRIISNMTIYFPSIKEGKGKRSIIVADHENGEQIQLIFRNSSFSHKLVGTINGEEFIPAS
jgi:hypothetical protein